MDQVKHCDTWEAFSISWIGDGRIGNARKFRISLQSCYSTKNYAMPFISAHHNKRSLVVHPWRLSHEEFEVEILCVSRRPPRPNFFLWSEM